jgi:hypothetical protein
VIQLKNQLVIFDILKWKPIMMAMHSGAKMEAHNTPKIKIHNDTKIETQNGNT